MTQNVANLCVKCDKRFAEWATYHAHVTGMGCVRVIKPLNVSGRSKAQIVSHWESKQKEGAIIQ